MLYDYYYGVGIPSYLKLLTKTIFKSSQKANIYKGIEVGIENCMTNPT